MSKVLIPVGDAIEAVDTLYPFFRVQEDGFEAIVAGQDARVYAMVMHEVPPGWDVTREGPSYHIEATVAFRDVDPAEYDGLFVSGGRAPEYLRYDKDLLNIVRHFFEEQKPVAVVCHGVEIVAAADVIRNRKMATVPKCQLDVEFSGGTFADEGCVIDRQHGSAARTWHDHHLYMPGLHAKSDRIPRKKEASVPTAVAG